MAELALGKSIAALRGRGGRALAPGSGVRVPGAVVVTLDDLLTDAVLDRAYAWLCHRRRAYPDVADVWAFRRAWPRERARLLAELRVGIYRIGLLSRVTLKTGEEVDVWPARDVLVMKCLALVLAERLGISARCRHLKGRGGSKGTVREVLAHLPEHRFVLRTDVAFFYASIDHPRLLDRLAAVVSDPRVLNLVGQYCQRSAERGGLFFDYPRGIPLGCPLSPVLGAFFLAELDADLERAGCYFLRYMDDVLVLAPTRWKLRRAVALVNRRLAALGLACQPTKTFIGQIARGFDFLGYHFDADGLGIAAATAEQFVARATRLYEQEAARRGGAGRLGPYVRRWQGWARGGLGGAGVTLPAPTLAAASGEPAAPTAGAAGRS